MERKERRRKRKKSHRIRKRTLGGRDLEETDGKRDETKTNKNRITHQHRWLRLQAAIFSHAFSGRSCKVSVKSACRMFFRASLAQPGTFSYFPSAQLLFQSPDNTLLHVNGLVSITLQSIKSSLNTLLSLSGLQAHESEPGRLLW